MSKFKTVAENQTLKFHVKEVASGRRRFENAAESVLRMILERPVEKKMRGGRIVYDYVFFREGKKHIIGWYDEINGLVHFVKDAAEGGSAKEMGLVFISGPGSGKTFFIDYLCKRYRQFALRSDNTKYTFQFINLDDALGYDPKVAELQSATFEDPMILASNIFKDSEKSASFLREAGFDDDAIEAFTPRARTLGASTEYLVRKLFERYGGDVGKVLEHVALMPVPITESQGTLTGKYASKDKITSSAVDLLGEEDIARILYLPLDDPNKFNLQRGALARVACGGVHFSDEIFKNKTDLVKIYLGVIQNQNIELDGFNWPIDCLTIATSNNAEYNKFVNQEEESPIVDRFRVVYVGHNTDYRLQFELTNYSIGAKKKKTVFNEEMHVDPNLNYATSVGVVLTRLLRTEKLDPVDMMKLEAGETAGEKGVKSLVEVKETANASPDVTKRWGQNGLGHRDLGRALQILAETSESSEGKCLFAKDVFRALNRVILDCVQESVDRTKFQEDLKTARRLYREQIRTSIFNAYREDKDAIKKDVLNYVNNIIGKDSDKLGPERLWKYKDPQTGEWKSIKIDPNYIDSVEKRLGKHSQEQKESFRDTIRKTYSQRILTEPNYDFMDNDALVKAVTDVRLESEVAGAGSLVGALANLTNEENKTLHDKIIVTMTNMGYCLTCALKTIEYFCAKEDES